MTDEKFKRIDTCRIGDSEAILGVQQDFTSRYFVAGFHDDKSIKFYDMKNYDPIEKRPISTVDI